MCYSVFFERTWSAPREFVLHVSTREDKKPLVRQSPIVSQALMSIKSDVQGKKADTIDRRCDKNSTR